MARAQLKASRETAPPQKSSGVTPASWLYTPALDLIVGCGAWSAPLLLVTYAVSQSSAAGMAMVFYALALVFNYPHFMATIYRAYGTREDFSKYRVFTVHITALLVLTAILTHASFKLLPWVFTLYINWSPWHYSGQNYGLLMMFARRNGATSASAVRRALYGAFLISYLMLLISFNTGVSQVPLVLSLGIPAQISFWSRIACGVIFALLGGFAFYHLIRQTSLRAMLAPLTLFSTQILWFVLPHILEFGIGWKRPQTLYSSGMLAVMHSAQYLWVTSYYARREAGTLAVAKPGWSLWRYFATLTAGGIALFIPGPWLVSYAFHYDITVSLLIFTALVNIHHFILDGAIWKLRDGRIAALLLNTREPVGEENSESVLGGATRWLRGSTSAARALRIAAMLVLFLWGGIEVVRYSLSFNGNEISSLMRALRLDPYDASAQTRIAGGEADAGDWQAAEAALRKAIAVNPRRPGPQIELGRALIEHGQYEEAYAQYRQIAVLFPDDADALTNLGTLAERLGHEDEAIASWQRALQADPARIGVHLLLAEALQKQSKPELASAHYEEYFRQVLAHPELRPEPKLLIPILLKCASLNAELGRTDVAITNYKLAADIAGKNHEPDLEGQAYASAAELQAKAGNAAVAARSYQQAIVADAASGDQRNQAKDWFNYGQLLRQRHLTRLAYACLLKSEDLLHQGAPSPELETATASRRQLETELGRESAGVRRDLSNVLAQATVLEPKDFPKVAN
ncbi:MAG TPA: tetratricopeptide repeat protein [Terriglobales bacterium]|jgi:tetratricopeptide (TPR) repeat protein|nr:tetratricopeptide repeat protein [Terriglobales bacterium]